LGQTPYGTSGIQNWQYPNRYYQKVCFDDDIAIQMHTQHAVSIAATSYVCPPPEMFLCDRYDPNTGTFHVIGAAADNTTSGSSVNLNVAPYLKGRQMITDNFFANPFTGASDQLNTSLWSFNFTDLGVITGGIYYILFVNYSYETYPTVVSQYLFSEPLSVLLHHRNTLYFETSYNANNARKNVVVSGWYDDYPTNSISYSPVFPLRCEGYILDQDPKAINIGYLQQLYDQNQIFTEQKRMKVLKVGELSTGIPQYMLEMVTAAILSDLWTIDGYSYICFNPSPQTSLSDMWKSKRDDNWTLLFASTPIMERFEAQGAILSPDTDVFGRIFTGEFSDEFA
jgi:hypothetical protein